MHTHTFTLAVKTHLTRQQAEMAVLLAFASRNPDNCEFTLNPVPVRAKDAQPSIVEEAQAIVAGDRAADYGDVNESFARISKIWSAYAGTTITPWDVAQMMILLKVSRAKTSRKRDTLVDIVGYAECASQLTTQSHPVA